MNTDFVYWSNEAWMDRFCQLGPTGLVIFRWNQQASAQSGTIKHMQQTKPQVVQSFPIVPFLPFRSWANLLEDIEPGDIVRKHRVSGK